MTNELLLNLIFYIVITSVIGTTLTKLMFMSEDSMIVKDAISRIDEVLNEVPLSESTQNYRTSGYSITLEHVSYSYDGRVAEQGKPEELMKNGEIYPHMVKLQMISQEWGI